MSTWRYCDDFKPHEMHEWMREVAGANPRSEFVAEQTTTDWHNCPGIKDSPVLHNLMAHLRAAEAVADEERRWVRERARKDRRTISEAMNCAPEHYYGEPDTLHLEQP